MVLSTLQGQEKESVWQKLFREQATGYKIAVGEKGDTSQADQLATVRPDPVLFWTQPVRGGDDGAVYLWTHQGRVVAIGTFFIWPLGDGGNGVSHELNCLAAEGLKGEWQGRRWNAPEGAFRYQALSGDPPEATAEKRLSQLKRLARQFTATSRDKEGKEWELRLLPRPIYRYGEVGNRDQGPGTGKEKDEASTSNPQSEIHDPKSPLDGAVLGFVQGTDLEVVLVIEAYETEAPKSGKKEAAWRYALARMSDLPLSVSLNGKEVWQVDRAAFDQSNSAYFCGTVERHSKPPE